MFEALLKPLQSWCIEVRIASCGGSPGDDGIGEYVHNLHK